MHGDIILVVFFKAASSNAAPAEVLQLACQDDQCGFFDTGLAENGWESQNDLRARLPITRNHKVAVDTFQLHK